MCSVSALSALLPGGGGGGAAPEIAACEVRKDRAAFRLVDVREPEEPDAEAAGSGAAAAKALDKEPDMDPDHKIPLGQLLRDAADKKFEDWRGGKPIVVTCNDGYRAAIAAKALQDLGFPAKVLQHGAVGWKSAAAMKPDLVVVLGLKDSAEKITLALSMCAAAAGEGQRVTLVLMADGVCVFLKDDSKEPASETSLRVNDVVKGAPFKPCADLLKAFLGSGKGVIVACTTCVKFRQFELGDLLPCVELMQLPDYLRMIKGAASHVMFT